MSFRREPIKPSASQTNKSFVPSADNRGSSRSATEQRAALRPVTNPNSISSRDSNTSLATTSPNLAQTHNSSLGTMDRIKERLAHLRAEADAAVDRAELAEAKNKKYEQEIIVKDQEIGSLTHKLGLAEAELEKAEEKLRELKHASEEGSQSKSTADTLTRKIQLLEEELDASEKNQKDTMEKLRQVDVKAEQYERQVVRLEQERDMWEKKYEDALEKYNQSKKELDELVLSMEGL
ncbi:hypothetical protein FRC03_009546 [Tulasnella sp. 419]|nr:hypothetical protein FRC03_009546 [Tulasnella sp. 419]